MIVRLKYYGTPVAGIDRNNLSMEIPAGSTVEGLISAAWGKTELLKASFLVNNTQAALKTTLNENDEVIVLRPLNGG